MIAELVDRLLHRRTASTNKPEMEYEKSTIRITMNIPSVNADDTIMNDRDLRRALAANK